jgi:hypothetical protein
MSNAKAIKVSREQECAHLLQLYAGHAPTIMNRIENQLAILASRGQSILSLAGVTITVTGFSGANIARSGPAAAALIVSGLAFVLVSATLTIAGILRVRWSTSVAPCSLEAAVTHALSIRDSKTRVYGVSLALLVVGLAQYVISVGLLLLGSAAPK